MKKLFIAISFLFLMTNVSAKEFIFPNIYNSLEENQTLFKSLYKIDKFENGKCFLNTDNLYFLNNKVQELYLYEGSNDIEYNLIMTFDNINSKQWLDIIFELSNEYGLLPFKKDSLGYYYSPLVNIANEENYSSVFFFTEMNDKKIVMYTKYSL